MGLGRCPEVEFPETAGLRILEIDFISAVYLNYLELSMHHITYMNRLLPLELALVGQRALYTPFGMQ